LTFLSNACTIVIAVPRNAIGLAGTSTDRDQDREQQGNTSRSWIAGEAIGVAGTE